MCCLSLHNFTPISPATTNQILKDSLYNDNSCTVCTIILRVINFTVFKVCKLSHHGILVLEHFPMKAIIRTFTKNNIPLYPSPCDDHVINPCVHIGYSRIFLYYYHECVKNKQSISKS